MRSGQSVFEIDWHKTRSSTIYPIFLPFSGCPSRCVFCAQDLQTGVRPSMRTDAQIRQCLEDLQERSARGKAPLELAFYGGTFTALAGEEFEKCLNFARRLRGQGLIKNFRCSTRPDSLDDKRLKDMLASGCHLVELGIQTFSEEALQMCGRDYSANVSRTACQRIQAAGMKAGIQLLPGMPGVSPKIFLDDVREALSLNCAALRFYPCLVIKGTKLASLWQEGSYIPWHLEQTLEVLAEAWLMAKNANVPVIRTGLAPQGDLAQAVLAGPRHPALGNRVMARGLYLKIKNILAAETDAQIRKLFMPDWCQGHFWGWKKELKTKWATLGVGQENLFFWQYNKIRCETCKIDN